MEINGLSVHSEEIVFSLTDFVLPYINSPEYSAEVEIDTLSFFKVPLFIFLNEIQGKAFVKKNTSCFIRTL